jgi:hypothetical protein
MHQCESFAAELCGTGPLNGARCIDIQGTRLHTGAVLAEESPHEYLAGNHRTGTPQPTGGAPAGQTDGPNSTVSQRSKGDTSSMSAPTRTAAEPGASAASGGASGASANGVSCEFPTP